MAEFSSWPPSLIGCLIASPVALGAISAAIIVAFFDLSDPGLLAIDNAVQSLGLLAFVLPMASYLFVLPIALLILFLFDRSGLNGRGLFVLTCALVGGFAMSLVFLPALISPVPMVELWVHFVGVGALAGLAFGVFYLAVDRFLPD
ncbi:MAG: hypothetical protein AAGH43_11885 [Pseudomonadota bacterium]